MKKAAATKKKSTKPKAAKKAAKKPTQSKSEKPKNKKVAELLGLKTVSPTTLAILEGITGKKLSIGQETFCQFITTPGSETFNNAKLSYAAAYGYDFDKYANDDEVWSEETKDPEGKVLEYSKKVRESSRFLAENVCAVNGHRLLINANVCARVCELLNKKVLKNSVVDAQMARWIMSGHPAASTRMIELFAKLEGRVKDVIELRGPAPLKAKKEAHKAELARIAKENATL